jgi:TPR repeat protein
VTDAGTSNRFLSGGDRPHFFRYAARLYSSDQVYRGLIDFAAIGIVVLLFLHPPPMDWFRGWMKREAASPSKTLEPARPSSAPTQSTATVTDPAPSAGGSAPPAGGSAPTAGGSAPSAGGSAPVSANVPMPAIADVGHPRLRPPFLIEIDERAFQSSELEDRQRLIKATRAHQALRYPQMLDHLVGARSSDPNVAFMRGLSAFYQTDAEHFSRAMAQFQSAVAGGHLQASALLGLLLVAGPQGVNKDVDAGKRLIEAAAMKGDPTAQRFAGIGYLGGEFGVLDPFKAAGFFKRAVAAGDLPSMTHYAHMLFNGAIVEKDEVAAEQLIERAAAAGLTVAQETLGIWMLDRYKAGVVKTPSEGIRWLERAYQNGFSITALTRLAIFYASEGRGSWRDHSKALELFRMGAAFSDPRSHFGYAMGFHFGYATAKEPAKAYTHYELARQLGSKAAEARQKALEDLLSPSEKASAIEAAQLLRRALKPIPRLIVLQRPGVPLPASPWGP